MMQARMPWGRASSARAWVKPVRPNLEAQYAEASAQPFFPATEETLTMVPPPASRMWGKTALLRRKGARRFTSSVRSQPSSSSFSTGPGASVPAAFTSTSTRPKASSVLSTAPRIWLSSAKSIVRASARRPAASTSWATSSRSFLLRASSTTSAPAFARAIAVARPRPLLAPVTMADPPSRLPSVFFLSLTTGLSFLDPDVRGYVACRVAHLVGAGGADDLHSRYPTALDDQRDKTRRHECPGPQEVEVEPGALEYHHAELIVDHDCYCAHHGEHRQRVEPDRPEIREHCCRAGHAGVTGVSTVRPLHWRG